MSIYLLLIKCVLYALTIIRVRLLEIERVMILAQKIKALFFKIKNFIKYKR
uniref:Uncharacterized protein n=1 Tax=Siphoviridae sp. ctgaY24 TaxID=2827911 RepID=A0A8S5SB65_9CAUD|nr:MAG TPA: hypothetical protein [Siphoviridae sp. ctgaY24]DAL15139.1 MAG TPA_asm: hypothetical protein [Caudoviricetes sp.]DAL64072.1 MAG TPA_asm: hypothetical protein [Caudoviricetes sp.]DAW69423.1 MAG TPA: hypothetical protein [Caudoviricetes sp.]DAZ55179.1 MAG TPA: hypothetical protein [Caudoviricetes sp.]